MSEFETFSWQFWINSPQWRTRIYSFTLAEFQRASQFSVVLVRSSYPIASDWFLLQYLMLAAKQQFLIAVSQKLKVKNCISIVSPSRALKSFSAQKFMAEYTCKVITFPVLSLFIETDVELFPSSVNALFPKLSSIFIQVLKNMIKFYISIQINLLFP
jgi:hypothetical protein